MLDLIKASDVRVGALFIDKIGIYVISSIDHQGVRVFFGEENDGLCSVQDIIEGIDEDEFYTTIFCGD